MKILNINKFHYIQGGADRHYLDLKKLLESHGHTVIDFAMQSPRNLPSRYAKYFVQHRDLSRLQFSWKNLIHWGRIFYSLEAKRKIQTLILAEKPDIVHLHNIYHQISPSILGVIKKAKIPMVMTVHDYKLICPAYTLYSRGEVCERCKKYKYYHCVWRKCHKDSYLASAIVALEMGFHKLFRFYEKYVDLFICPSQYLYQKLKDWGLPQDKLVHIPYFIKTQNIKRPRSTPQNYVLYFGRLSPEKGITDLLAVAKALPHIPLRIVGQGPQQAHITQYLDQHKLSNVQVMGYQSGKKLTQTIAQARFVVVPSQFPEMFGLVILEAYRLGKTVLARKRGGIPELVLDQKTGLLFQNRAALQEKIEYLYNHPAICQQMATRGHKTLNKFSSRIFYSRLSKIYRDRVTTQKPAFSHLKILP